MANLLANKKIILSLIKFLKTLEIGVRKEAKKKKIEWEQKNNQIEEDLLG